MRAPGVALRWLGFGLLLLAGGCATEPYVYTSQEFNRTRKDFGRDPTDIRSLVICYSSQSTTPEAVTKLAEAECGKFKKRAVFAKQEVYECPLLTPVSASYACQPEGN
jgi:hypothetical protein